MSSSSIEVPRRTVNEWSFRSDKIYTNPFTDVVLDVVFTSPDGKEWVMPAFYDGDHTWRVRFNASEQGEWNFRSVATPSDLDLMKTGVFQVTSSEKTGFLKSTPGNGWGFHYENGQPAFLLGDTIYNVFGAAYCDLDVLSYLKRRASQGFNLFRVRLPVSPFHPPDGYSNWQTRRTWPWGGSEQSPRFDQFNLDYFHTVDMVMDQVEALGVGFEMIMEAYGFEFPFNRRDIFVPEWEELWLRYLIARYDAYNAVYFWTLMNEYEYYPDGNWNYKPVADRWVIRVARWIRETAPHKHILSIHNGPSEPPFATRFSIDLQAIDTIMFQQWGTFGREDSWLAAGIEESIQQSMRGWSGTTIFAEYGYERNPEFDLLMPIHEFCDKEHTRRGAWRGAFCGLPVIHGFENSWGPWQVLDRDQPGLEYLLYLKRFFTEVLPFYKLKPTPELILETDQALGYRNLALASDDMDFIAVYLPVGGKVTIKLPDGKKYQGVWFDPRRGTLTQIDSVMAGNFTFYSPPNVIEHPWDWALALRKMNSSKVDNIFNISKRKPAR